jgi:hypothetical protein
VVLRGNSCRPIATELAEIAHAQDTFFSAMLRDDDPQDTAVRRLQRLQQPPPQKAKKPLLAAVKNLMNAL